MNLKPMFKASVSLFACALLLLAAAGASLAGDSQLRQQCKDWFDPIPEEPPVLKNNKLTDARIKLGRMLYFEPRLSASNLVSCQFCHNVGLAGADLQETSTGHGWQQGPRNAPTTYNAVFNTAQFWDGRAKDLAEQSKGPVQAGVEMSNTPEAVVKTLKTMPEYVDLFKKVFPEAEKAVTFDNMAKAIEAFEATLLTPNDDLDRFMKGDDEALSAQQKEGAQLFIDKSCASCHKGVNLGGTDYYPFGVAEKPESDVLPREDKGRFKVTNLKGDEYVYRSPALRNVALTMPYFHSGKVWKLEDAVAIMGSAQLGIELNAEEVDKITAFLEGLTGEQPEVTHPVLPPNREDTPKPRLKEKPYGGKKGH